MSVRQVGVVVLVSGLWLSGCTSTPSPAERDWGPLAVTHDEEPESFGRAGGGLGEISIGESCVTLREDGDLMFTLVWRSGQASWDRERGEIAFVDPELGNIELGNGTQVRIFGAPGPAREGDIPDWLVEPRDACPSPLFEVHRVEIQHR